MSTTLRIASGVPESDEGTDYVVRVELLPSSWHGNSFLMVGLGSLERRQGALRQEPRGSRSADRLDLDRRPPAEEAGTRRSRFNHCRGDGSPVAAPQVNAATNLSRHVLRRISSRSGECLGPPSLRRAMLGNSKRTTRSPGQWPLSPPVPRTCVVIPTPAIPDASGVLLLVDGIGSGLQSAVALFQGYC